MDEDDNSHFFTENSRRLSRRRSSVSTRSRLQSIPESGNPQDEEPEEDFQEENAAYTPSNDKYRVQRSQLFLYIAGRVIGIIPFSNNKIDKTIPYNLHFRFMSVSFIYSMILILVASLFTGIEIAATLFDIKHGKQKETGVHLLNLFYLFYVLGTRIYFVATASKILRVLDYFVETERNSVGLKLKRKTESFVFVCRLISIIGVCGIAIDYTNFILYLLMVSNKNESIVYRLAPVRFPILDKTLWTVPVTLITPFVSMAWGYSDLVIMVVSAALRGLFVRFNVYLEHTNPNNLSILDLEDLRDHHRRLARLVQEVNDLLSPLVLICYAANIGYFFDKLYLGLLKHIIHSNLFFRWRSLFTLVYQLGRILYPSLMAAAIHYQAHRASYILRSWSSSLVGDTTETASFRISLLYRFTLELQYPQISLSGCGFFHITKPFIMGLLSALATYEFLLVAWQAESMDF